MEQFDYAAAGRKIEDVFGFSADLIRERVVLRAAAAARSYVGGLYPPSAPGMARWMHSVALLRETLMPLGWEPDDTDLLSRAVRSERRLAIVPTTGNALTGLPFSLVGKDPSTKWPKGERTADAVARNGQLALFGEVRAVELGSPVETWMLLQHATTDEIRAELSLPATMNARGYITSWAQRFLLPPVANDFGVADEPFGDDGDGGIDIIVEPR